MRKNFLLLFLMALLPLAGWAASYDVQVTTYNGSAVWCGGKPAVQSGWFTAAIVGGGTPSNAVKTAIAGKLQVKDLADYNVGPHDYQLELKNATQNTVTDTDDNVYTIYLNSSTTATLTITQYTTAPDIDITSLAYVTSTLTYDPTSEGQALLSGGATATTYNSISVPVIYALSNAPATEADIFTAYGDVKAINAGNYTVYYKVAETANYVGTDWTAIAGDAKNIAKATQDFTAEGAAPTANTWTYDATAHPLVIAPTTPLNGTYEYCATNSTNDEDWVTELTSFTATKNADNKIVYWRVKSDNYEGKAATQLTATINKATPVLDAEGVVNTAWNLYDGANHNLFLKRATVTIGETTLPYDAGVINYNSRYKAPGESNYSSWGQAKTSPYNSNFQNKKNAGSYQVQIFVEETDDYKAVAYKPNNAFAKISVAQADMTGFTAPEAKTGLRVKGNNEAQDLVTEASWGDNTALGTFQYKVGEGDWSTDVPKGTTAGTYSVGFQIVPTDAVNYKTYALAEPLSVTINEKSTVTIAVNEGQTFGYGTTPVIANTVTWSPAEHPNVDFSTAETKQLKWKWYDNAECSGDPVALPASGYYPVGSYYVKGYNAELTGDDADYWQIAYTPALVQITAGQVTAKISATATYGSLPTFTLTHVSGLSPAEAASFDAANNLDKVTVKKDGAVVNNLANVAKDNANLATLAAGEYDLEATASCGTNYAVVVTAGKLTVNPNATYVFSIEDIAAVEYKAAKWEPVVTVTGLTAGTDYTVSYGDDTHDNFHAGEGIVKIAGAGNYAGATGSKTFTINKADLTITADNFTGEKAWTYGTDEPTYTATVDGLKGNDALPIGGTLGGINGTLKVKRTSNETVGMHTGALVAGFYDADDNKIAAPVATNYNLNFVAGDLQVAQAALTIKLKNNVITGTYGNAPSAAITAAILTDKANYELDNCELTDGNLGDILDVSGVTFTIDPIANNKYEVNDAGYEFTMTGATTTNYAVTISNGTYKVNPADITLYANDQAIDWSDNDPDNDAADTEVKAATVTIAAGALKCGDALTDVVKEIVIASQNVGTNNISLTAAENANYNIVVNSDGTNAKYGVLTVTGAPALTLSSDDADLVAKLTSYNGKAMPVTIDFAARSSRELPAGTARTWTANTWVTLTLPFDISVADLSKALGYAIVNVVDPSKTEVKGNETVIAAKLTMKGGNGKDDVLAANKPFMVKTADAITGTVNFGNQTIVAPGSDEDALSVNADENGYVKLIGTYTKKTVTGDDNAKFWFMMGGNYNSWAYIGAGKSASWDVLPFEGYIDMSGVPAGARNMTFIFEELDGSTTAIKSVNVDDLNGKIAAEGMYNMNGMKLNTVPTQKGVYIMNGKKVVIK